MFFYNTKGSANLGPPILEETIRLRTMRTCVVCSTVEWRMKFGIVDRLIYKILQNNNEETVRVQ